MKRNTSVGLLVAAAAISSLALALDEKPIAKSEHVMFADVDLKWSDAPTSLPAGAKIAVLEGDPGKPGPFTIRLQMPAGYKIAPHTHPTAERITMISGTSSFGMGPKFDEAAGHEMTAGGFAIMPTGMQLFAWSKGGCVVQVHSTGPFEITTSTPRTIRDKRRSKRRVSKILGSAGCQ
ncbi:MAG TPA: cupin domain-containing protein, partial [Chthoniobacterales bacterium]|nr:cupin domain-containing protein [Chthoniobacterales bacterium]